MQEEREDEQRGREYGNESNKRHKEVMKGEKKVKEYIRGETIVC